MMMDWRITNCPQRVTFLCLCHGGRSYVYRSCSKHEIYCQFRCCPRDSVLWCHDYDVNHQSTHFIIISMKWTLMMNQWQCIGIGWVHRSPTVISINYYWTHIIQTKQVLYAAIKVKNGTQFLIIIWMNGKDNKYFNWNIHASKHTRTAFVFPFIPAHSALSQT